MKVISNKWIYKVKKHADGTLDKLKARLVARGFEQLAGIDFQETFSPVVKASTVRFVFSIAATRNWKIEQLDVSNAFLHGVLEDTTWHNLLDLLILNNLLLFASSINLCIDLDRLLEYGMKHL